MGRFKPPSPGWSSIGSGLFAEKLWTPIFAQGILAGHITSVRN